MGALLALDLASTVGLAEGVPGLMPRVWTWRLGDPGASQAHRFAELLKRMSDHLAVNKPDAIWIEAPLPPSALATMGSTPHTAMLLLGLPAIVHAVAYLRGVYRVRLANVQDVRKHFCGQRRFSKGQAKGAVMDRCRVLGWRVANDHEADACALWSYACGQSNPRLAAALDPLFATAAE